MSPKHAPNDGLGRRLVIQHSALAGFRHHAAPQLLPALLPDTPLTLEHEPDNPFDPEAVALYWRGIKLGYLPRDENFVAARLLQSRRSLSARIERVDPAAARNQRLKLAVLLH